MIRIISLAFAYLGMLIVIPAVAAESKLSASRGDIPFKEDRSIFVDAGLSIGVLIAFIVIVVLALWYLRKHNIGQFANMDKQKYIEIVEIKRLSTKSMAFLLKVKDAEVLVVQNADSVHSIQLDSDKK